MHGEALRVGIVNGLHIELWPGHPNVVNGVQKCEVSEGGRQGQRFLVQLFLTNGMKVRDGPHEHAHPLHSKPYACNALSPPLGGSGNNHTIATLLPTTLCCG